MHINILFTDKRTHALHVESFEASTQAEFNGAMQQAEAEACARFDRFSVEAETFDGDEQLLTQWHEEFEPVGPAKAAQ